MYEKVICLAAELKDTKSTEEKIEVFKKYNLPQCKVFLFDEETSQAKEIGKPIKYGDFQLLGLGDYRKLWVIDHNTIKSGYHCLGIVNVINYDLNILTYLNKLYRKKDKNILNKEYFLKFLEEIKNQKFDNNIATALMERYSNPINLDILLEMIESYVYFDSLEFKDFISNSIVQLPNNQYKRIEDLKYDISQNLNKNFETSEYDVIVCYVLKAFMLKNNKNLSKEEKVSLFKEYCLNTLSVHLEFEISMLIPYLKNDDVAQNIFSKLQIGAKDLKKNIYNTAWDIYHIRLLEIAFQRDNCRNSNIVYLHYFATADKRLLKILEMNPLKMIIIYSEGYIAVRKDNSIFFSKVEANKYFTYFRSIERLLNANNINFKSEKDKLMAELETMLSSK